MPCSTKDALLLRLSGPWSRLGSPVPSPRPPLQRSSPLRERAVPPPDFYPVRGSCLGLGSDPPIPLLDHRGGERHCPAPRRTLCCSASRARGPARIPGPRSLSSTTVAAVVFAPRARGAAAGVLLGLWLVPRRSPLGPVGPARIPRSLSSTTVAAAVFGNTPLYSAKHASQLGLSSRPGARGPARTLSSFSPTTVATVVSASLRERAAPLPGPTRCAARAWFIQSRSN